MEYVNGRNRITARSVDSPGMAPNTIPIKQPAKIIRRFTNVNTSTEPFKMD